MKRRTVITICLAFALGLLALACGKGDPAGNYKEIKSTSSGGMRISLASESGEAKSGENDLILTFSDSSDKPVDVGAASLKFHMPGMGAMAEMNNTATLTKSSTPGQYRARINIQMGGTWEARVNYKGSQGTGQATMSVTVK